MNQETCHQSCFKVCGKVITMRKSKKAKVIKKMAFVE